MRDFLTQSRHGGVSEAEGKIDRPARSMKLERAEELIRWCPGVRKEMVADLRDRILDGTYEVAPEQLAERIIQDGIQMLGAPEGNRPRTPEVSAYD